MCEHASVSCRYFLHGVYSRSCVDVNAWSKYTALTVYPITNSTQILSISSQFLVVLQMRSPTSGATCPSSLVQSRASIVFQLSPQHLRALLTFSQFSHPDVQTSAKNRHSEKKNSTDIDSLARESPRPWPRVTPGLKPPTMQRIAVSHCHGCPP